MPQLDQVTFFSQYFWLCLLFFTFYLFLYKHFLPKMSRILKYRKRKVALSQQGISTMEQENEKAGSSYQTLLFSGLSHSASLFDGSLKQLDSWLSQVLDQSNHTQLSVANRNYIYSLGEKALSSQLALSHPFGALPENLFIPSLLGTPSVFPKKLVKSSLAGGKKEGSVQSKSLQLSQKGAQTPHLQSTSDSARPNTTLPSASSLSQDARPPLPETSKSSSSQGEKPSPTGKNEKRKKKEQKKKR